MDPFPYYVRHWRFLSPWRGDPIYLYLYKEYLFSMLHKHLERIGLKITAAEAQRGDRRSL